jgi:hypothetical protein
MTTILKRWTKQTPDRQDFDVDFSDYMTGHTDGPASYTVSSDSGLTVTHERSGNVVKLWAEGGTNEQDYRVAVTMTTTGGRVKQADVIIEVRDAGRS